MEPLSSSQRFILEWLSREDFSSYRECYGPDLDALVSQGLAQTHDVDRLRLFGRVSLTEKGLSVAASIREAK